VPAGDLASIMSAHSPARAAHRVLHILRTHRAYTNTATRQGGPTSRAAPLRMQGPFQTRPRPASRQQHERRSVATATASRSAASVRPHHAAVCGPPGRTHAPARPPRETIGFVLQQTRSRRAKWRSSVAPSCSPQPGLATGHAESGLCLCRATFGGHRAQRLDDGPEAAGRRAIAMPALPHRMESSSAGHQISDACCSRMATVAVPVANSRAGLRSSASWLCDLVAPLGCVERRAHPFRHSHPSPLLGC
jgi:hypothetical protein